jgi:hypothetical protein
MGSGEKNPGPVGRGLLGAIIVVCLIALLAGGIIIVANNGGAQIFSSQATPTGGSGASATQTSLIPTATPAGVPTTTTAPQPTNTPQPRATATTKSRRTNTLVPACLGLLTGSGAMDGSHVYLNSEVAAGVGGSSSGAQVQFSPAPGLLTPLNGAKLADKGAGGSGGYTGLTCAQLESASYAASSVAVSNGEIFFARVADGHLAKVLVTVTPGNPFPSFTWTTYNP